jgi:hypothetical protein
LPGADGGRSAGGFGDDPACEGGHGGTDDDEVGFVGRAGSGAFAAPPPWMAPNAAPRFASALFGAGAAGGDVGARRFASARSSRSACSQSSSARPSRRPLEIQIWWARAAIASRVGSGVMASSERVSTVPRGRRDASR